MKRVLAGLLWGALVSTALAGGGPRAVRRQVQASMVVTGTVEVTAQGVVSGYRLDRPERLPEGVRDLVGQATRRWRFAPVLRDGRAVAAHARMSLRLVATPAGQGRYTLAVRSAYFGDPGGGRTHRASSTASPPATRPRRCANASRAPCWRSCASTATGASPVPSRNR